MEIEEKKADSIFQNTALDIIAQILDCAGDTAVLAKRLTETIREMDGCQFAVLTRSQDDETKKQRVIHVSPEEKMELANSANCQELYAYATTLQTPVVLSSHDDSPAGKILSKMGFDLAIAVPLIVSDFCIGAILSIGISQTRHIRSELNLLQLLSTIVSLAVRNSILIEKQEKLIAEKTWELMDSNIELRRKEAEARALAADSERSRRALLDALEDRQLAQKREELIRSKMMDAQKLEAVGRLAGGVAHDFNNALSVIIGYNELILGRMDKSNPLYDDLMEVLNAARKSVGITRQLLAFARKQVIEPVPLKINDTIEKTLKIIRRLIGEDIELSWNPGYNVQSILIDAVQFDQIMTNLALNARDAIGGSGRIIIETRNKSFNEEYCAKHPDAEPGDFVELIFSDNGCGISTKDLSHIFEPFFTTKEVGKGTGLGLATVYGIVRQNGGFINVESKAGKGTTFRLYFPQLKMQQHDEDKVKNLPPKGRGETILLVEDDAPVLCIAKNMLTDLGYRVLPAQDAETACGIATRHKSEIRLLLTDIVMPGMNGYELALKLKSICPNLKVLYMSGYTADIIAKKGLLDKDMDFMPKPFSVEILAQKVKEALEKK